VKILGVIAAVRLPYHGRRTYTEENRGRTDGHFVAQPTSEGKHGLRAASVRARPGEGVVPREGADEARKPRWRGAAHAAHDVATRSAAWRRLARNCVIVPLFERLKLQKFE
jgi:hypothetical protein